MDIMRQGDVLLRRIPNLPEKAAKKARDGDVILAWGEVTGHAHRIADPKVVEWTAEDKRFLEVTGIAASLTHEEHATVTIEPGLYEIVTQREYEPGPVGQRAVED